MILTLIKKNYLFPAEYTYGSPCPADFFYSECNECFCLDDGKSAGCTLKLCSAFKDACKKEYHSESF